jgi:thiopeptide-type bacteriocin biosynthesis protein
MQALRKRLHLPRWVAIMDGDNLLPIDLDNVLFVDVAAQLLKNRSEAALVELFYGPDDIFASGPEGRFTHELVVPFVRVNKPSAPASLRLTRTAPPKTCRFPPGSEWLYAKLYTGTAGADVVLREIVRPVVQVALSCGAADRWFFVRYGDPDWHIRLRLHGDRRRLLDEVLPALLDSCAQPLASDVLWRFQLDTYEREVERYGGPLGVAIAERLFHVDSDTALDVVEVVQGDQGADARWRLALVGIDRLLSDLGMQHASRHAVVGAARNRFGDEFHVDRTLRRQLDDRYRRERASLASLLGPTAGADQAHPVVAGLVAYAARSHALRPIVAELRAGARSGHLTRPLTALAGSYIHMHANRILRSATRAQELVLYDFLCRLYKSEAARRPGGALGLSDRDYRA